MKTGYSLLIGAVIALMSGVLSGQETQPGPSFEVASIKPSGPFSLEKMTSGQMPSAALKGPRQTSSSFHSQT
jgi:hypothetical protein